MRKPEINKSKTIEHKTMQHTLLQEAVLSWGSTQLGEPQAAMASTRRSSGMSTLSSSSPSAQSAGMMIEAYEHFKRKHLLQNKEIIHRNSELSKLNADLQRRMSLLRAENLSLKGSHFQQECEMAGLRDSLERAAQREREVMAEGRGLNVPMADMEAVRHTLATTIGALQAFGSLLNSSRPSNQASPDDLSPSSDQATFVNTAGTTPSNVTSRRTSLVTRKASRPSITTRPPDLSYISEGDGSVEGVDDLQDLHSGWAGSMLEELREETLPSSPQSSSKHHLIEKILSKSSNTSQSFSPPASEPVDDGRTDTTSDLAPLKSFTGKTLSLQSAVAGPNKNQAPLRTTARRTSGIVRSTPMFPPSTIQRSTPALKSELEQTGVKARDRSRTSIFPFGTESPATKRDEMAKAMDRIEQRARKLSSNARALSPEVLMNPSEAGGPRIIPVKGVDDLKTVIKRRKPAQLSSSSEEDENDRVESSIPLPNRRWTSRAKPERSRAEEGATSNGSREVMEKDAYAREEDNQRDTNTASQGHSTAELVGGLGKINGLLEMAMEEETVSGSSKTRVGRQVQEMEVLTEEAVISPETTFSRTEDNGGEARRARKSVNYALPKLNTKMRQPEGYVPSIKPTNALTHKTKPRKSSYKPPTENVGDNLDLDEEGVPPQPSLPDAFKRTPNHSSENDIPSKTFKAVQPRAKGRSAEDDLYDNPPQPLRENVRAANVRRGSSVLDIDTMQRSNISKESSENKVLQRRAGTARRHSVAI